MGRDSFWIYFLDKILDEVDIADIPDRWSVIDFHASFPSLLKK